MMTRGKKKKKKDIYNDVGLWTWVFVVDGVLKLLTLYNNINCIEIMIPREKKGKTK